MTNVKYSKCNLYHLKLPPWGSRVFCATSSSANLDNHNMKNSSLAADLGKVQLQGVVQHHIESLEHVIVSSLSPRQDSAAEVMRLELGETFEDCIFFLQGLCSQHGEKQNGDLTFSSMHCLMCLVDLSIWVLFSVNYFFVMKGFSTYLPSSLNNM